VKQHLQAILSRWSQGWQDALASALAAALAWALAQVAFGHGQPIFASVAAVVCLAPGIPSRAGQALNMMLGLVTGIAVGEAVLIVAPPMNMAVLIAVVVLVAIMAAISFGLLPVIAIQGGVSALLVLALGPEAAGAARFLDAVAGTAVGLVFSQIFLTPDPVKLISAAASTLLADLGAGLALLAEAVDAADATKAASARTRLIEARDRVNILQVRIASAHGVIRWSLHGRLRRRETERLIAIYSCRGVVLHASALVLSDVLTAGLQAGLRPPRDLASRIQRLAASVAALSAGKAPAMHAPQKTREDVESDWRPCLESLDALERLVSALEARIGPV
jgi:uncharacterized membrane protein YgaE (UPF0421/DUF939 family)